MKLLKKETLGSPQYLMVHTGTNDLHSLLKDTAEVVRKMAKQASKEFPETCIVISPLPLRTDTHPHVIHDINMEIRRDVPSYLTYTWLSTQPLAPGISMIDFIFTKRR